MKERVPYLPLPAGELGGACSTPSPFHGEGGVSRLSRRPRLPSPALGPASVPGLPEQLHPLGEPPPHWPRTFTFHFHALEKEMATHSGVLAWRIPGMAEPGGLPSMGSHTTEVT